MRILLAIDGMEHSGAALNAVCDRDWPDGSVIKVVNVLGSERGFLKARRRSDADLQAHVEATGKALARIAADLSERLSGLAVESAVATGDVSNAIQSCAEAWRADLVVVGTADKGDFDRMLSGSVSQSIVQQASCPVLVARRAVEEETVAGMPLHILVAVDHSMFSSAAIEWAVRQKWKRPMKLHLLSVVKPSPDYSDDDINTAAKKLSAWQHNSDQIATVLEKWAVIAEGLLGADVVTCDLVEGDPVGRILEEIKNWPADLVVMGSHGRSGLIKLVMGSVSQAVSAQAPCSVEVVRGQQSWYHDEVYAEIRDLLEPEHSTAPGDVSSSAGDRPHIPPMSML